MARSDLSASFYGGNGFTLYHASGDLTTVPLSPHFHDEYLICAQLRGEEDCHVAGKLHHFAAGDVVLINPQQVHTGNTRGAKELEYISLYVDRELVRAFAEEHGAPTSSPEFTLVKALNHEAIVQELCVLLEAVQASSDSQLYPLSETPDEDDVELPPSDLGAAATEPPPSAGLDVESALHRVVMHTFEEFSNLRRPVLRSTTRVGHRKIARALDYIRSLPPGSDPAAVTLEELAKTAGLSKFHFLRQFSQVVGMTPGAYLRTLRLCHAARKLRTTSNPILDIAVSVGFSDHPSFSRAFARHMGMTPSDYRRLGPL